MYSVLNLDVTLAKLYPPRKSFDKHVFLSVIWLFSEHSAVMYTCSMAKSDSLNNILKRHCYGYLDFTANPDYWDWLKEVKPTDSVF